MSEDRDSSSDTDILDRPAAPAKDNASRECRPADMAPPACPRGCARRWAFRLSAVVMVGLLLGLAECLCVWADWGAPSLADDPFVGFAAVNPLFELSADGEKFVIPESRRNFFAEESFPARKTESTRRIFCLGGSTVQGRPFSIPTAFSTWLELALNEVDPQHDWDVINCGGISYASYRLVPILQECLTHQPDLIILCTGHNEFLEDRTYGDVRRSRWRTSPLVQQVSQLRLVTLARQLRSTIGGEQLSPSNRRPILTADADAMLDYHDGLAAYHRDEDWRAGVIVHFEQNVRRMVLLAQEADVPIVLMQPASNLSGQAPFKSEHRSDLSAGDIARWERLGQQARASYRTDLRRAVARLQEALTIDDQYAMTYYELGRCLEAQHDFSAAREAFVAARDLDICPLRILSEMEHALQRIADKFEVPFLDMHALLERETPRGILGDYWLIDHIHPSIHGHQFVSRRLVELVAELQHTALPDNWRSLVDVVWQRHLDGLDELYYLKGQRTLNSVMGWTRGEAEGTDVQSRFPHRVRSTTPTATARESSATAESVP